MNPLARIQNLLRRRSSDTEVDSFAAASPAEEGPRRGVRKAVVALVLVVLVALWGLGFYWSRTPDLFDPLAAARQRAAEGVEPGQVAGYVTTATLIQVMESLLDKPGGYLSNDVLPPSVFLDNMPNWEFGVLIQARDLARSLRNDMSRSRSQSTEDPDLAVADPQFSFNSESWLFPPTEREYRKGMTALESYLQRLADPADQNTQFYARADNLADWLDLVNKRMGSLSQRLSASVGQVRLNIDLAGEPQARQATAARSEVYTKTPWLDIDDVFFEARGSTWAIVHFLRAVESDFQEVLEDKNALVSLRQIIRELEQSQRPLWSPIVLNGSGFGIFANHSLTMASYIARANAALIDLRKLLADG